MMMDYIDSLSKTAVKILTSFQQQSNLVKIGTVLASVGALWVVRRLSIKGHVLLYKSPPYYPSIPFIGPLYLFMFQLDQLMTKILPKYGDLVEFNMLGIKYCVINNPTILAKIYQKADLRDQTQITFWEKFAVEVPVVASNYQHQWQTRRKILMQNITKLVNKLRFI